MEISKLNFSKKKISKKGVSPVVATVLLVAIVIIIALIIFLWFRSFTQEAVTKFGGQNIQLVCDDVEFIIGYSSEIFSVSNIGNVPIYSFSLRVTENRGHRNENVEDLTDWPTTGLRQGESFTGSLDWDVSGADEILAIPVLMGTTESGEEIPHTCEERQGKNIDLN